MTKSVLVAVKRLKAFPKYRVTLEKAKKLMVSLLMALRFFHHTFDFQLDRLAFIVLIPPSPHVLPQRDNIFAPLIEFTIFAGS